MLGLYNKCNSQLFNICSHWPDSPNRSRRTFQIGWDSDFSCAGVHKAAGKMHGKTKECNLPGCRNVISKASLLVDALKASQMKKVSLQIHPSTSHSTVSSTRHSTVLKLISKNKLQKRCKPWPKKGDIELIFMVCPPIWTSVRSEVIGAASCTTGFPPTEVRRFHSDFRILA